MAVCPARWVFAATLLCIASVAFCDYDAPIHATASSSSGKPLIKRPPGRTYRTILSMDGGGLRGVMAARLLVEFERTIKAYLLNNPYLLPPDVEVATLDDFDINLADYFDCMTGASAGAWSALYLASRGGQGASRFVLDDPAIVERYGSIHSGGAEGLLVFYKEYGGVIFPAADIDLSAGTPFDVTNPSAPGVLAPLYPNVGLERTLKAFLGETTLADLSTSVLIPALDLISGQAVYFVQNRLRKQPVTSSAVLKTRTTAREPPTGDASFSSDFEFGEWKDYYLVDAGMASAAVPIFYPAKSVSQVGSEEIEFKLVDGVVPVEATSLPATFFVASETDMRGLERIAVLSLGSGLAISDLEPLENAGAAGWLEDFRLLALVSRAGQESLASLIDYLFYSNPAVRPYQYLRIQTSAPVNSEEGMALSLFDQAIVVDPVDAIAIQLIDEYRASIDAFVRDFIFG